MAYLPRLFKLALYCNVLYIQKRLFPKWILNLVKQVNNHIIFDFDDAIYLQLSRQEQFLHSLRSARLVITGNSHLSAYASKYNPAVIEIPTVINTDYYHATSRYRHLDESRTLIGWIGMDPDRGDLDVVTNSLTRISSIYPDKVALLTIARKPYSRLIDMPQIFIPWTLETSLQSLQKIDIGIMPLEDTEWNRGKCAFKLIQYSSVNAAAVASPVGMNKEVIIHNNTGFLADTQEDWFEQLSLLIRDSDLRLKLGQNGRHHIEEYYSVNSRIDQLVHAIEMVARQ
jgi:glycosyltransferase involved in cell wall biosynthesis